MKRLYNIYNTRTFLIFKFIILVYNILNILIVYFNIWHVGSVSQNNNRVDCLCQSSFHMWLDTYKAYTEKHTKTDIEVTEKVNETGRDESIMLSVERGKEIVGIVGD